MTKSILGLCSGILALTAIASAQTPQSPASSSNLVTRQSSQTDVVTGCVAADSASEPGATSGRRFILSNAQWLTEGDNGQGRQTAATSYLLTNSDLNLGDHVGHKVQLTGYVDSSSTGASSAPTPGSTSSASMRVFHATSVRMLSQTCP
jgi:hypothetical protein